MPKTKLQGVIFGVIMSYSMAIGMEVYNIAIKMGYNTQPGSFSSMTNAVFPVAVPEAVRQGIGANNATARGTLPSEGYLPRGVRRFSQTPRENEIPDSRPASPGHKKTSRSLVRFSVGIA